MREDPRIGLHHRRRVLPAVVALILALLAPGLAFAHAALVDAQPADGGVVPTAPDRFMLEFNEPVSPLVLRLIGADGSVTLLERYDLQDKTLAVEAPELAEGTHVLSWRVVSEDGHPIGGSVVFSIGAPSVSGPPAIPDGIGPPARAGIWLAKVGLYLGLFLGLGGAFFLGWIAPDGAGRRSRTVVASVIVAGLLAAPVSLGLQGIDALDLTLDGLSTAAPWKTGFATSYGSSVLVAILAFLAGLASLYAKPVRIRRLLSLAGIAGVGAALAASGHASAASPQWLTRPAVFAHGVAVAFWIGALMPLGFLLAGNGAGSRPALLRFSQLIPVFVALLLVAGGVLAVIQVGMPSALLETDYGRVLLVKLVLLAALLGLAAVNRWRLTATVATGGGRKLARAIALETVLALAIIGTAAVWRFTPPPRVLAIEATKPAKQHVHTERVMADLTVTPGRAGPTSVDIILRSPDFAPFAAKEVTLVLANPGSGIEPIRRKASMDGEGTWSIDELQLPLAGVWAFSIDVLVSDYELLKLEAAIEIRR